MSKIVCELVSFYEQAWEGLGIFLAGIVGIALILISPFWIPFYCLFKFSDWLSRKEKVVKK